MNEMKRKPAKRKPEISYDRASGQFQDHCQPITDAQLWEHWNKVGSADYTQGAWNKIIDLLQKGANR